MSSQYIVGIDLGTTNTVVAYTPHPVAGKAAAIEVLAIEQLVDLGEVAARPALPSCRYHAKPGEIKDLDRVLPWGSTDPQVVYGALAQQLGSQIPGRLVTSAKSWLSHANVDRLAEILPWGSADDTVKVSPVTASASYLSYIRSAWHHQFPSAPLEQQDVVITVPASFDDSARRLTIEAAYQAGLTTIRLVEEPQAAFYDYVYRHRQSLNQDLQGIKLILVCDVGGGTTDLTLIRVEIAEQLRLERIGVGDHLMLGGDNMDLGLAQVVEKRLVEKNKPLSAARFSQLMQQCRAAKEQLLANDAPPTQKVTLLGAGSRLMGGALSTELKREEVNALVVDGFFPLVDINTKPQQQRSGFVEFGLPYAADPAISRHIGHFLTEQAQISRQALGLSSSEPAVPQAVLLNGGVFRSHRLQQRLVEILGRWRQADIRLLANDKPELAVACGAVAHGLAQLGHTPRIGGGSPRSYFLMLDEDAQQKAVCLLPRGSQENVEIPLPERSFALRLNQPVQFHLLSSTSDQSFTPGQVININDPQAFVTLPPLATSLATSSGQSEVTVALSSQLTELGTLETACIRTDDADQRWVLEFHLRGDRVLLSSSMGQSHPRQGKATALIQRMFGPAKNVDPKEIKRLRTALEKTLGQRETWNTPLLRNLGAELLQGSAHRRRTEDHERVWFNLSGFCLRPGYGFPLDEQRVSELWKLYEQGVQYRKPSQIWSEWWTLWRRVAAGLEINAQVRLYEDIAFYLQPASSKPYRKPAGGKQQGYDDMVRLAASLEHVPAEHKSDLGNGFVKRLKKASENPQTWWAVGRIGARMPFYGSAHNTVAVETVLAWLQVLLQQNWKTIDPAPFAATQLARRCGDRDRDIPDAIRHQVASALRTNKAPASWVDLVENVVELNATDERRAFGESLPPGLRLIH